MAASPALSNNSSDTATTASTAVALSIPPSSATTTTTATATAIAAVAAPISVPSVIPAVNTVNRTDTPPKTLRGLNKPKCKQCGNVARSRCPYESCKSCCAKAQNPCHIHVLKANATFPDKAPTSSSPLFDQQSTDASSSGNSHRVASYRHLSSSFSQFSNVQIPVRSRKPLTRKDAAAINEWRFSKLKEYKERSIEVENESFDRYMQNVNLLEELFSVKSSPDRSNDDESSIPNRNPASMEDGYDAAFSGLKLKMRSNPLRTSNFRKRIHQIVDRGLKKLQKSGLDGCDNGPVDPKELDKGPKSEEDLWAERASTLNELVDKLNKARNEEDLKSCLEVKSQLFNHHNKEIQLESRDIKSLTEETGKNDLEVSREVNFSLPSLITPTEIDQETLRHVDAHFSSLDGIENL
ncbi:hypothetical protein F8388_011401 [Cannabis sativa]|uniref:Electron carrier/iron ion-binding protein n=1 Tax=Cannabis sativa TaxID=3483 RepID=A0A7J6I9N3_CANSA|nr:hypothetical protein F8388_011401 [Cannabis sativa]KAF4404283.1 hypothetical protein G4B88_014739 [Cannabis sativa]